MKKNRVGLYIALGILIVFTGCPKPITATVTPPLSVQVDVFGKKTDVAAAFQGGVPYTLTHEDVIPAKKVILSVTATGKAAQGKAITGIVAKPVTNPPVTLTEESAGKFALVFSKVDAPVPVRLQFKLKDESVTKNIDFTLLPEPIITGVTHDPSDITLGKAFNYTLTPQVQCSNKTFFGKTAESFVTAENKKITYSSSNAAVAVVNSSGILTTVDPGTSDITLKTANNKTTIVHITVDNVVSPKTLTASKTALNLKPNTTETITISPSPSNGSLELEPWVNTDAGVGKIEKSSSGYRITALAVGSTTFTTRSKYNPLAEVKITLIVSGTLVNSITLNHTTLSIEKDKTAALTASVLPAGAPQAVVWSTTDTNIADVNESGTVSAKGYGTAVIRATSKANHSIVAQCVVKVAQAIDHIVLDTQLLELEYGDTHTFTASVVPASAAQDITWSVDDPDLLAITSSGKITAKNKRGKAIVTATSTMDSSKKTQCTVYVAEKKVSTVTASVSSITMDTNASTSITITVSPTYACTPDLKWDTENDNLVLTKKYSYYNKWVQTFTVKSNNLAETKKITFTSKANPAKTIEIPVTTAVPTVASITVADKTIATGQASQKMTATVLPANAVQTVTWTSDNTGVVLIDATTGLLSPIGKGTATITATSTEDTTKKGTATVRVEAAITGFSLDKSTVTVYSGHDETLTITPSPSDGWGVYKWSCDNADITLVADPSDPHKQTIKVTNNAAQAATATITVTSQAAPAVAAQTCSVSLKTIVPKKLAISSTNDYMYKDDTLSFSVYDPTYASPSADTSVTWSVSGYHCSITQDGKLTVTHKSLANGSTVTVTATSTLDSSVVATKEITVYDNIATISAVSIHTNEITLDTLKNRAEVGITWANSNIHKKCVILPTTYGTTNAFLTETTYTLSKYTTITGKSHTSSTAQDFYVFPVDPRTGDPVRTDTTKKVSLTIWSKPTSVTLTKGNFVIFLNSSGWYDHKDQYLKYNTSGYTIKATVLPASAKQHITVTRQSVSGYNHAVSSWSHNNTTGTCTFSTGPSGLGVHERSYLNFIVDGYPSVKTKIRIMSN